MSDVEDDDFEAEEDGEMMMDDIEDIDEDRTVLKFHSDARRRLEQLKEEKELQRLIRGDLDDWDFELGSAEPY